MITINPDMWYRDSYKFSHNTIIAHFWVVCKGGYRK